MTLGEAHILLVDDEPTLRLTMGYLLRGAGATVTEAANVEEVLLRLREGDIDLLLTDWQMPGTDGITLLRAAVAEGVAATTVLCSGLPVDAGAIAGLPIAAVLLKPFAPPLLLETVRSALACQPRRGADCLDGDSVVKA